MRSLRNTKRGCGKNVSEGPRVTECVRREGVRRGQREPKTKLENGDLWVGVFDRNPHWKKQRGCEWLRKSAPGGGDSEGRDQEP